MECRFIFPNGNKCRCRATTGHVLCRHNPPHPTVPTRRQNGPRGE